MINVIVTDIEGTTTSLSFVKDVLFPYARERLPDFVRAESKNEELRVLLQDTRLAAGNLDMDEEAIIAQLLRWMDQDQKVTPLKELQGLIWESGYQNGDLRGHVYDDAAAALKQWQQNDIGLYVYSSGSVHAQKLLFSHSNHGDLSSLFSDYFDTYMGSKLETESYQTIGARTGVDAGCILFLSDTVTELDAAAAAGWRTLQLTRPGEAGPVGDHPTVDDFSAIDPASFS